MTEVTAAEACGYDAIWLAEIHFQKDRSVLAAPLAIAAALAGRTTRVKLGIAVQVLPLSHPLHIAEDVATIDHLSGGRVDLGVGRSGLPAHYQGFNIPYAESRDRFLETLDILVKAWTQERFTHEGTYLQFRDVCLVPKPFQRPHPPDPHRRHDAGHLSDGRSHGLPGLPGRAHLVDLRADGLERKLPRGVEGRRPSGAR